MNHSVISGCTFTGCIHWLWRECNQGQRETEGSMVCYRLQGSDPGSGQMMSAGQLKNLFNWKTDAHFQLDK